MPLHPIPQIEYPASPTHTSPHSSPIIPTATLISSLDIPLDIHLIIIPLLSKPELAAYSRLSQAMNLITVPYLYKRLEIDLSKKETILVDLPIDQLKGINKTATHEGKEALIRADLPFDIQAHRFSYTTHLTIKHHSRELCLSAASPNLPNLHTLNILCDSHLDCCMPALRQISSIQVDSVCPLLLHLRPRRLIIRSESAKIWGRAYGLGSAEHNFPPASVEEVVVQLGSREAFARRRLSWSVDQFLCQIPDTIQKYTLVLRPEGPEGGSSQSCLTHAAGSEAAAREIQLQRLDAGRALLSLSIAFVGRAQRMQIVGLETVDMFCHMSRENTEGHLRSRLETVCGKICDPVTGDGEGQISSRRWTDAEAEARAGVLEFIRLEDYQDEDE